MLLNYAKTALRSILGSRGISGVNILGLATGLCCFLFSVLYIRYELGYDARFAGAERLYRISIDSTLPNGRQINLASNAWPVADLLQQEFAQITDATRLDARQVLLSTDELALYQDRFRLVDANFFSIFDLPWLAGDRATALVNPGSVVLTESVARRYFGEASPLGRQMLMDKEYPLVVTGVIADLPVDSHLTGDAFASTTLLRQIFDDPTSFLENWNYSGLHTYFVLAPGADITQVEEGLDAFETKYMKTYAGLTNHMRITALQDIYRAGEFRGALKPPLNTGLLYVLGFVALAILLIACVNFVNLTLARGLARTKEVGVRKSTGARTAQLVQQFVGEAMLVTAGAMLMALLLLELLLPTLSQFANRPLALDLAADVGWLVLLVVVVGAGAGLYPAWRLSSLSAALATRGNAVMGKGRFSGLLKNSLVVFQFTVSIILLVATAVVLLQVRYLRSMDMGFTRDGVVTLQGSPAEGLGSRFETLKRELLQNPQIMAVTASSQTPFQANLSAFSASSPSQPEPVEMAHLDVSFDFFTTYGIQLLAGRRYSPAFPADMVVLEDKLGSETPANFIVNAAGAAAFGWTPEEAVGKPFEVFIEDSYIHRGTIVGVVADSRIEAAHAAIRPTVFMLTPSTLSWNYPTFNHVSVKLTGNDLAATLKYIDDTWAEVYPEAPVTRGFVSDDFERVYISETRLSDALGLLACLALFIACLGLFGLASFNAQRRTKEIGVRKVMGSSVWGIVVLLTNDFSRLVLLSNVIAWPVAYFAMNRWLENFAYRIDLTPMIFIGSGLIALCITWVTVGGTAARAASRKPVLALRYE